MSALDPAVKTLIDKGQLARLDLVRLDLPGKTVGYHRGGRPFTYNGLAYLPNRWLLPGDLTGALGAAVTTRTLVFSYDSRVPAEDVISRIESYAYLNAPVIVTVLAGDPATDQVVGVLASNVYEIDQVRFPRSGAGEDGVSSLTVEIDIQPPGRSARGATLIKVSPADHQFDNGATDTALEYVATNHTITEEWGRVSG